MNKKLLKQLILVSYKNGKLDEKIVNKIADRLNREELKIYIKALKMAQKQRNVYIESPFSMPKSLSKNFEDLFPEKNILNKQNPTLLVGTKIMYNDDIFEMNLKNSLDSIVENVESYD